MDAEDLIIHNRGHGHAVEHIIELLPDLEAVSSFTFVAEPVDPIDRGTLVVAPQHEKRVPMLRLVAQK